MKSKTLEQLAKQLKLDYVSDYATETNFPDTGRRGEVKILHFGKYISSEDAIKEGEKQGLVPATPHEMLLWEQANWNGKDWVVALGQTWRDPFGDPSVLFLGRFDSERHLDLDWFDDDWRGDYRFVFCKIEKEDYTTNKKVVEVKDIQTRIEGRIEKDWRECWNYKGGKRKGYGLLKINGVSKTVHRVFYEILVAPIPEGYTIDHLCKNKACVNPAHLQPVTAGENSLRGNGPPAQNARKTHCKDGHPLSGENLYSSEKGRRVCIECRRKNGIANYHRKKALVEKVLRLEK